MFVRSALSVAFVLTAIACGASSADTAGQTQPVTSVDKLRTCRSIGDSEGRCISERVPEVAKQKNALPTEGCSAGERCAPCFDPTSGEETGACSAMSGDAPTEGAKTFAACCGGRAKCVPGSNIDRGFHENLEDCEGTGQKCVPSEFIDNQDFAGAPCDGNVNLGNSKLPYKGVCLSDCLSIESENLLSRDGCKTGELCVPCEHPVTGAATGAPGCK
jgi:hypothetical protein